MQSEQHKRLAIDRFILLAGIGHFGHLGFLTA